MIKFTGKVNFVNQGIEGTFVNYVNGTSRFVNRLDLRPFGHIHTIYIDGDVWVDSPFEQPIARTKAECEQALLNDPMLLFSDWSKTFKQVNVTGKEKIDNIECYVVRCVPHHAPVVTRYIDVSTGLLRKDVTGMVARGIGEVPTEFVYDDYRDVLGVQMAHKITASDPFTGSVVMLLEEVAPVQEIPKEMLERPAKQK
jgi:hypothetical protein